MVDNSGPDAALAELMASAVAYGRYLEGGGQGFARAANLGARCARRELRGVRQPGLPAHGPAPARAGDRVSPPTRGPRLTAARSSISSAEVEIGAGGWEPSVRRTAVHATGLHKRLPTSGLFARPEPGRARRRRLGVRRVPGGAYRPVRRSSGGFDETFFVYSRGRLLRSPGAGRAACDSVLRPDILVPHAAGSSGAPSAEMLRMRGASFAGYVRRYHSPAPDPWSCARCSPAGLLLRAVRHGLSRRRSECPAAAGDDPRAADPAGLRGRHRGRDVALPRDLVVLRGPGVVPLASSKAPSRGFKGLAPLAQTTRPRGPARCHWPAPAYGPTGPPRNRGPSPRG